MLKMNKMKANLKKEVRASFFYVSNAYKTSLTDWFRGVHAKVDLSF